MDKFSLKDSGRGDSEAGDSDCDMGRESPVDRLLLGEGFSDLIHLEMHHRLHPGELSDMSWLVSPSPLARLLLITLQLFSHLLSLSLRPLPRLAKSIPLSWVTYLTPSTAAAHTKVSPQLRSTITPQLSLISRKVVKFNFPMDFVWAWSTLAKLKWLTWSKKNHTVLIPELFCFDFENKLRWTRSELTRPLFLQTTPSHSNVAPAWQISAPWTASGHKPIICLSTCLYSYSIHPVANTIPIVLSPILPHSSHFHARYHTERGYSASGCLCYRVCGCACVCLRARVRYLPLS